MKIPALLCLAVLSSFVRAELTDEQKRVPLEVDTTDPKLTKIVLLAGSVSSKPGGHEYFAGCTILANALKQTTGVWPVMAADGWPKDEHIFDNARAIVVYADGGAKLPFLEAARWEKMRSLVAKGTGLVMLHQAVEGPEDRSEEIQSWLGGVFKKDIGCRGHWDMSFDSFPKHAITRGVAPFSAPGDGWLYNLHFAPNAVPVIVGQVPDKARTSADAKAHAGRAEVLGWACERANGGRSFAFTGADWHTNWKAEGQRRLVVNGILWSAKMEVPESGAPVAFEPGDIAKNWDNKPKVAPKAAVAPAEKAAK
ncbi:MAG: ThuA domain-containing protein [Chthoniobacteraceae bacterium]